MTGPMNGDPAPPPAEQLYAWLSREPDGTEGIAAAILPQLGLAFQLVSVSERLARGTYAELAGDVARVSGLPHRLVRFTRADAVGFACPRCGKVSHNPRDAAESYCGNCHLWPADMP